LNFEPKSSAFFDLPCTVVNVLQYRLIML